MKLTNKETAIVDKRKVYYVTLFDNDGSVAGFLSSAMSFVTRRPDAALFSEKEDAEELMKQAESNGITAVLRDFSHMHVSCDTQYQFKVWEF